MGQQSTSCWIRRCNRQYIFPRSSLSSAAVKREMKNSSLSTRSQACSNCSKLHQEFAAVGTSLRTSCKQDRRVLSLFTASAAAGHEPRGADDRPNSLEKTGQPRAELFPTEKRLTMNALHSLENRARVLFAQTHNS